MLSLIVAWLHELSKRSRAASGQGLVEYALILVLVAVVVIIILSVMGGVIANNLYGNILGAI
jgi:pilus assembly protein Flp/PilA